MLDKKIYLQGIGVLASTFQNYKMTPKVMYPYLEDLSNKEFTRAIDKIIKTIKGLYPNDNIIAIIRETAKGDESIVLLPYHEQFKNQKWMEGEKQIGREERKKIGG